MRQQRSTATSISLIDFLAVPPIQQWHRNVLIGIGWYNGLTHGICLYDEPKYSIMFDELAAEMPKHGSRNRLFRLFTCPLEPSAALVALLRDDESAQDGDGSLWFPVDSAHQEQYEALLSQITSERVLVPVVAEASNSFDIQQIWGLTEPPPWP